MDLYDPIIIEYNKRETQYGKRPDAQYCINAYNPMCGDAFQLYFDIEEGKIRRASFSGYGCAVSKAATAVLMEKVEGAKWTDAMGEVDQYLTMIESGNDNNSRDEKWKAFILSGKYPGRKKCATLSWGALRDFLIKRD